MKAIANLDYHAEDSLLTTGSVDVEIFGRMHRATWRGTSELEVGKSLVVWGPSAGAWYQANDQVSVVTAISVVGDRTNTTVETSNEGSFFGNWSRMRFLVLDQADSVLG